MVAGCENVFSELHFETLAKMNINLVVNLLEEQLILVHGCENFGFLKGFVPFQKIAFDQDMNLLSIPIQDTSIPTIKEVQQFLYYVKKYESAGKKIVVHCHAGVGRTGVMLASYLITKYSITAQEAIIRLRQVRPNSMQYDQELWYSGRKFEQSSRILWQNMIQINFLSEVYKVFVEESGSSLDEFIETPIQALVDFSDSNSEVVSKCHCLVCSQKMKSNLYQIYNRS